MKLIFELAGYRLLKLAFRLAVRTAKRKAITSVRTSANRLNFYVV